MLDELIHEGQRRDGPLQAVGRDCARDAGRAAVFLDRWRGLIGEILIDHFVAARRVGVGVIAQHGRAADHGVREVEGVVGAAAFEEQLPERGLGPHESVVALGVAQRSLTNFVARFHADEPAGRLGDLLHFSGRPVGVFAAMHGVIPHAEFAGAGLAIGAGRRGFVQDRAVKMGREIVRRVALDRTGTEHGAVRTVGFER